MKKLLGGSLFTLLVLGVGGYIALQYFFGTIAKSGVNKFGPNITQTPVQLQDATISPLSGVGTLTGLTVGNPPGWSQGDALRLGKMHLDLEPRSLFGETVVINELIIEQPEFLYETRLVSSNIREILNNIEQSIGAKSSQPQTDGKPVKLIIRKLVLRDGKVTLGVGQTAIPLPMPPIDMNDIGVAEGGLTPAQVAFAVMRNVTTNVVAATTGAMGQVNGTSGAAAIEAAKQAGEAIKGLFGGGKKK